MVGRAPEALLCWAQVDIGYHALPFPIVDWPAMGARAASFYRGLAQVAHILLIAEAATKPAWR